MSVLDNNPIISIKGEGHRWSGWPGAWCLDCGCEDPVEICASSGHPLFCGMPECQPTKCPEPDSHNHDPYWKELSK